MAEIKAHEFDRLLSRATELYRIFLVYGPDKGLVSERAKALAEKAGVNVDDPFSYTRLDLSELQGDPGRLIDEVNSLGLFGGQKVIHLRGSGGEKIVADAIAALDSGRIPGNILIIEGGDLKKGSALRKNAEQAKIAIAVPCYSDDVKSLNALIDQELAQADLRITPEARATLLEALGGDRVASRNEIRKLILYCMQQKQIEQDHVTDIIGDASAISADDAVDCVLAGDLDGLHRAIQKIVQSKQPIFLVLQSCLRTFQMLDAMRAEMEEKRLQSAQIMQTSGRHIHFKRKPLMEKALRNWSSTSLARETQRLHTAIYQSRQQAQLDDSIAFQTLLASALQSQRANRS